MPIAHAIVTVGTDAVRLNRSETDGSPGQTITVQNMTATPVYLGASTVTTVAYGHVLEQDGVLTIVLASGDDLYAVAGSETTVNVLALGV